MTTGSNWRCLSSPGSMMSHRLVSFVLGWGRNGNLMFEDHFPSKPTRDSEADRPYQ